MLICEKCEKKKENEICSTSDCPFTEKGTIPMKQISEYVSQLTLIPGDILTVHIPAATTAENIQDFGRMLHDMLKNKGVGFMFVTDDVTFTVVRKQNGKTKDRSIKISPRS